MLADGFTSVVCQKLIQCTHVLFVFVLLYFLLHLRYETQNLNMKITGKVIK